MYILTLPAFTWIGPIPHSGTAIPSARAGHTCDLRDGQIVLVGGFTNSTTCDSPGIYIFNASSLSWSAAFTALSASSSSPAHDAGNSVLAGSYGYTVPDQVVAVVGGSPGGAATATAPAVGATGGPFATGRAPVFTVTAAAATSTVTSPAGNDDSQRGGGQVGLIAAVVVAVLAGLAAGYLGFCAWVYRRQVRAYKTHFAVTNRFPATTTSPPHGSSGFGALFGGWRRKEARESSSAAAAGEESFAWVGRDRPAAAGTTRLTPMSGVVGGGGGRSSGEDTKSGAGSGGGDGDGSAGRPSLSGSADGLLEGQELSFFSVVLGPRRALRVVNGLEDGEG